MLAGYRVHFTPGWDCHGLPIELNALKALREKSAKTSSSSSLKSVPPRESQPKRENSSRTAIDVRRHAREYAASCVDIQKKSFMQMNLLADWNRRIYRTLDVEYLCNELDLFLELYEKKLIYRAYMPVGFKITIYCKFYLFLFFFRDF